MTLLFRRTTAVLLALLAMTFCNPVPRHAHAAETDRNKTITVYTEPSVSGIGNNVITDTGIGLDTLVTPSNAHGYKITWRSSNKDVATVDSSGHVHGTLTGKYSDSYQAKCKITATVSLNGRTDEDTINVIVKRGYDIESISMSPSILTLKTGQSYSFNVTYTSSMVLDTRKEFYFISSDPSVAFVDPDGKVTAKRAGTATVTVYTLNGKHASGKVTVTGSGASLYSADEPAESGSGELLICYDSSVSNKKIKRSLANFSAEYESSVRAGKHEKAVLARCSKDTDVQSLMNKVMSDGNILYIQPNFRYSISEDDPYYTDIDQDYTTPNQYFHFQSRIDKAWELLEKNGISQTTVVGVVDSGVDADHIDLSSNLILSAGKYTRFENGEKLQDTNDISGRGHGTHVAGIIGAVAGNGIGGAGAASGNDNSYSKVLPVGTVTDSDGTLNSYDVIKAINFAAASGAKVINLSFGGPYRDRLLGTTIQKHYKSGIVFVAAAGNESTDYSNKTYDFSYPSDIKEVISVCNIDRNGIASSSTNFGFAKDISAPGVSVYSTTPGDTMTRMTGTSMSSPVVSSVCALMLDANPDLTPAEIRNILCGTALYSNGYYMKNELGYGALDAYGAVQTAYDIKSGKPASGISIYIKTPYRDKENYINTKTSLKAEVSSPVMLKSSGRKGSARLSFGRSKTTITTTKNVISTDPYTGDQETVSKTSSASVKETGIKYKIGIRRKGSSKWKYYRIPSKSVSKSKYSVTVRGNKIKVTLKKLTGKKRYYVKVQAYSRTGGKLYYSAWTKARKIKVKKAAGK